METRFRGLLAIPPTGLLKTLEVRMWYASSNFQRKLGPSYSQHLVTK